MDKMNVKVEEYKTTTEKIKVLKAMHATMLSMNNEYAYDEWVYTMPDCPSEDDFKDIATDSELFKDCVDEFNNIFNTYIEDGLFDIELLAVDLLKRYHITVEVHF